MAGKVLKGNIGRDASVSDLLFRLVEPVEAAIARARRQRYCGTYVGVTGSCGKTTTSAAIATMLAAYGSVRASRLTSTNRAALRTLRKLVAPTDYVVQEISGNYPGAIAGVTRRIAPDVAVVTAVGQDHWSAFRSLEAIAAEKGSLVAAVPATGVSCLNADDPLVRAMADRAGGRVVLFGRAPDAAVRADNIDAAWPSRLRFELVAGGERFAVATSFVGAMMLTNLLGAFAVVHGLGLPLAPAVAALATMTPVREHMSVSAGAHGHTYILDTDKAPQWSTALLIEDMAAWRASPLILVLGEMSDIKNETSRKYRQALRRAAGFCDLVIGVGPAAPPAHDVRRLGCANVVPALTVADVPALLAGRPPSLVVLKSNTRLRLAQVSQAEIAPRAA
jgi:UDP-N-acetylmuramoyl-tripeptide--D-alanyl-D-alanine ligase